MSAYNGSGTFLISGAGLPFVTATTISSTVANQLNSDLATGLSTAICKDGQTTPTANLPMGGFKHTGAAVATASGQYLCYAQGQVVIGAAAAAAFGIAGTGFTLSAFTQTDSTTGAGTVATAYASSFGAATFATASNAVTITNAYGAYFTDPVAGSHVTLTNKYALGADTFRCVNTFTGTGLVDISTSTAGQIKFPPAQNSSANANTLDDYEEGTWTPTDGSGAGLTFTSVNASYTKIGNVVTIYGAFVYPSTADGSNSLISGLPYASQNVGNGSVISAIAGGGGGVAVVGIVTKNAQTFAITAADTAITRTNANLSTRGVIVTGQYFTPT